MSANPTVPLWRKPEKAENAASNFGCAAFQSLSDIPPEASPIMFE
jgi:hypothetical protein